MGVRGLTTYINSNQDVFMKKHYLYDSKLVIDGLSLTSQLYRCLNCFSAFGGDYDKYAAYVRTFFKQLKKCNITAYVIFDGSYERRKLKTVFSRLRTKLKNASRLDPVTQGSLQIFPLLLRDVFKDVLTEMNVPYMVCEFEADDEIASLASYLNCPVLSYDSDFFIYNVLYVPFNTLELKSQLVHIQGERKHVMECKLFQAKHLTKHFDIQDELLPLLAILLGNDYIEKKVFRKFFSQLKLQKCKKKKNDQQRSIHSLFKWLQNETFESAIVKILGRLKKNEKGRVLNIIRKGVEGYSGRKCQSLQCFNLPNNKVDASIETKIQYILKDENVIEHYSHDESLDEEYDKGGSEVSSESELDNDGSDGNDGSDDNESSDEDLNTNSSLPYWFVRKVHQNEIPVAYLNLYTNHLHFCIPQADDYTDEDPFLCTLPILRYAFDILTDFDHEYCVYIGRDNNCRYKKIFIEKEMATPRLLNKPFSDLTVEELQKLFHYFLQVKMPDLDLTHITLLPTNFQLFMISMLWWIKNCNVPVTHIHSLIISYITLEVIDEKTGTTRGHFLFNNKNSKKLEELRKRQIAQLPIDNDLYLKKNKVQYEDCLLAASILLKHFEIDDSIRKKPKTYDVQRVHSFAQFQCILQQFNSLNILCSLPYEKTVYHKCYNGTFVYNLALKMEKQTDPEQFIKQYLAGATTLLLYYKSICSIIKSMLDQIGIKPTIIQKKKRKVKKKQDDEITQILRGLEIDVVI